MGGRKRYDKTSEEDRPDAWRVASANEPCLHDLRARVVYSKLDERECEAFKDAQKMQQVLDERQRKIKRVFNHETVSRTSMHVGTREVGFSGCVWTFHRHLHQALRPDVT